FQFSLMLTQLSLDKLAFQFLWPESPVWAARSDQALGSLAICFALLFAQEFLARRDRTARVLSAVAVVMALVSPLTDSGAFKTLLGVVLRLSIVAISRLALLAHLERSVNAKFFIAAWTLLLLGAAMAAGNALGVFDRIDGFAFLKAGSTAE